MKRVVITGLGCVTPVGSGVERFWKNLTAGRSGVGPITVFDAGNFPVRIAAEVDDWDPAEIGEDPETWREHPRGNGFAIGAGLEAAKQAGVESSVPDPGRFGIYLGCGEPFADFEKFARSVQATSAPGGAAEFVRAAREIFDPAAELEYEPLVPGLHLAARLNAQGPNLNCIAACASSTQAIGEAARTIRRGDADVMLAGGAHSTIHPFGVTGFHQLSAVTNSWNDDPTAASRPFDRDRDGFVIGEGAAALVLEDLDHARRRGAEILAELTGYCSSQDAYRITDTHPEGRGIVTAIKAALGEAKLNPEQIDYINAHGTSTVINDKVETHATKAVFGEQAYRIPISSTKSMLGHATTGCGGIEIAACVMAIRTGVVPPTINYETPDPQCDLDYVPNNAREVTCRHALSNNLGFGGQNAAMIVSRFEDS